MIDERSSIQDKGVLFLQFRIFEDTLSCFNFGKKNNNKKKLRVVSLLSMCVNNTICSYFNDTN